ncbi:hypothetical protein C8Q72DRAFT_888636 [Fomitopsis betulina]|nr:hypothetical protein C8Q72DRAFT_888636 [Fomitopsis betulina]
MAPPAVPSATLPLESLISESQPFREREHIAVYPFNNPNGDADVIFQTADGTLFYLHWPIMRLASPFYCDMSRLPQPPNPDPNITKSNLPIIPIEETAEVFDRLLRMCYPVKRPMFFEIPSVGPVLAAAMKYQMSEPQAILTDFLFSSCPNNPLPVYAVACMHGLESVAKRAAETFCLPTVSQRSNRTQWSFSSASDYTPTMDSIPAASYYKLLSHHAKRTAKPPGPFALSIPEFCSSSSTRAMLSGQVPEFKLHPFDDPKHGEIILHSVDGVDLHVHAHMLSYASPVFRERLSLASITKSAPERLVINTSERGLILAALVRLCYPLPDFDLSAWSSEGDRLNDLCSLFDAAKKYEVVRAQEFAKHACVKTAQKTPLRLYLIASHYGWKDIAEDAAVRAIYELVDDQVPEMEYVRAAAYRRFLVYRQKCRNVILSKWYNNDCVKQVAVHAEYWSQKPWLENSVEAQCWETIHRRAQEQARSIPTRPVDVGAILPSSMADELQRKAKKLELLPKSSSSGGLAAVSALANATQGGTHCAPGQPTLAPASAGQRQSTTPATPSPSSGFAPATTVDGVVMLRARQRAVVEIAEMLMEVKLN